MCVCVAYSAFNNTNCVKAMAQYQNRKILYQYSNMTRLNAHFSVKGISVLNSEINFFFFIIIVYFFLYIVYIFSFLIYF